MKDPVTLHTGITYDRDSIEKWLYTKKNNTCPVTKQVLLDMELTPNHTVRRLIQSWCTLNPTCGVERVPTPRAPISKTQILKLLKDLKTPTLQMKSLKRLKMLVLESETNKRSMEAAGAVEYLTYVINNHNNISMTSSSVGDESVVAEFELVTPSDEALGILYQMHISQATLQGLFAKNNDFLETLTRVMQRAVNYETRTYAVLLLKSMFDAAQPMQMTSSLKHEFFVELVNVLNDQISHKATKATLKLLINVCLSGRNRIRAAEASAVPALIDILLDSSDKRLMEMVLLALDQLCQCAEGRSELLKHGAGMAVVSKKIFRVSPIASDRREIVYSWLDTRANGESWPRFAKLCWFGRLAFWRAIMFSKIEGKTIEILKMPLETRNRDLENLATRKLPGAVL
ncbi:E3 ubiquitin protein ligase PUB23-like protein [Tanacetum coccineum]